MALSYQLQVTLLAAKLEADISALAWKKVGAALSKALKRKNIQPYELPILIQKELRKSKKVKP